MHRYVCPLDSVRFGLETLEERRLLSNGIYAPVVGNNWNGEVVQGTTTFTNWVSTTGTRIVDDPSTHTGYPGEYNSGDEAIFTSGGFRGLTIMQVVQANVPCNVQGETYDLGVLTIESGYTSTVTMLQNLTENGGGSALHFSMTNGNLDVHGNVLTIEDDHAGSWTGGNIQDTTGGGQFDVKAVSHPCNLGISANANKLTPETVISGASLTNACTVTVNAMVTYLSLDNMTQILVENYGTLALAQDNSAGNPAPGSLLSSIPNGAYDSVQVLGGNLYRQNTATHAVGIVQISNGVYMSSGTINIDPGSTLTITGQDASGSALHQTGGATTVKVGTVGTAKMTGQLDAGSFNHDIDIEGGNLVVYVNPTGEDLEVWAAHVTIYSGAEMNLYSDGTNVSEVGTAEVKATSLTFDSGSSFRVQTWGNQSGTIVTDVIHCTGSVVQGGTMTLYCADGSQPLKDVLFTPFSADDGFFGEFALVQDTYLLANDTYQWVQGGTYKRVT